MWRWAIPALVFLVVFGPYLLITGRAPFKVRFGRWTTETGRKINAMMVRVAGGCFTLAVWLPAIFYHRDMSGALFASVWLMTIGFFILVFGILRGVNQPRL